MTMITYRERRGGRGERRVVERVLQKHLDVLAADGRVDEIRELGLHVLKSFYRLLSFTKRKEECGESEITHEHMLTELT